MYMLSLWDAVRSPSPGNLAKSFKGAWMYADHFVPQLKHCWLRNVNMHTLKAGQGAPGMGHWLYTLPTAPFTKWRMDHSNGDHSTDLAWRHLEQATYVATSFLAPSSRARHRWMP